MQLTTVRELAIAADESHAAHDDAAPALPRTPHDTELPFQFLAHLVCKIFLLTGPQRLGELAGRIKLPPGVLEPVVDFLRRERLAEVASSSTGSALLYALTDLGRSRADEYLRMSQYAGPAPVSLRAYTEQVRRQAVADMAVTRADMQRVFSGIVVADDLLDRFGAAMNSGRAIFVHGPAGAGKTFIAEKLAGLLGGNVYIPHAILVDNQVIQVFDPLSHVPLRTANELDMAALAHGRGADQRWMLCRRPEVIAGGELTLGALDLQFDHGTRYYAAPPQLKANNGVFVVDDLGRQLVQAKDLMNRWIVPLDRRVDYLALHTGEKFTVPFELTVVFCTNLSPADLADDAFLRRLGYKIHIGALDEVQYRAVCRQVCASYGVAHDEESIDRLLARFRREHRPLLACTPRDLIGQVRDQARYAGAQPELTTALLDWAWSNYFTTAHQAAD